ncbi:MAG: 16S rRNA (guanine(527)-N(7))-methyltransferase RsmG [Pseudomonadota bacterium]
MEIGASAWRQIVQAGSLEMGAEVTGFQMDQLALHSAELIRWNRKTNLTAITTPEEIAVKHVLDAMAPLPHLPASGTLLDIGSGGGFPGVVLKILRPDLSATLIDASRKKVSFLSHVIRTLGLKDISALQARAEALAGEPPYAHRFDVIVSRALCALDAFVAMALPLLAPDGLLIAFKGRPEEAEAEIAIVPAYAKSTVTNKTSEDRGLAISSVIYRLPRLNIERTLVLIRVTD